MKLDTDKLLNAEQLLAAIFPDTGRRPSLRWLRNMQKERKVPFLKIGRKVFFDEAKVRAHWEKKNLVKAL